MRKAYCKATLDGSTVNIHYLLTENGIVVTTDPAGYWVEGIYRPSGFSNNTIPKSSSAPADFEFEEDFVLSYSDSYPLSTEDLDGFTFS